MKMPNPEVISPDGERVRTASGDPAADGVPSSSSKAPSPSAIALRKPICNAQYRFSKPLPKKASTMAAHERQGRACWTAGRGRRPRATTITCSATTSARYGMYEPSPIVSTSSR